MVEVCNDIRDVLDSDGYLRELISASISLHGKKSSITHPNEVWRYTRRQLLVVSELLVRRGGRMDNERLCVA